MEEKKDRNRGWVFTLNNPEISAEGLEEVLRNKGAVYYVFQAERGEKGTTHYQGYVFFKNAKTFSSVQKTIPKAHLEAARGTPTEASNYCKKEDTRIAGPWEWGELPVAGKRTDLQKIVTDVKNKRRLVEIIEEDPGALKYIRHMQELKKMYDVIDDKPRTNKTRVYLLTGDSGTCKTYSAEWAEERVSAYKYNQHTHWFDGYRGQDTLIIDEFDSVLWMGSRTLLLKLMDYGALDIDIRGGKVPFNSTTMIITANKKHPWDIMDKAFWRRIDVWIHNKVRQEIPYSEEGERPEVWEEFEKDFSSFYKLKDPETIDDPDNSR